MTVLRKRDRQIAFRVSEEEYRALQIACLETGARSISDLAREATRNVAVAGSQSPLGAGAGRTLSILNGRVERIEEVLELLMQGLKDIRLRLDSPEMPA